jgi:hypothetical protein
MLAAQPYSCQLSSLLLPQVHPVQAHAQSNALDLAPYCSLASDTHACLLACVERCFGGPNILDALAASMWADGFADAT